MSDSIAFIYVVGLLGSVSIVSYSAFRINEYWMDHKYPERSDDEGLYVEDDEVDTTKVVSGKS